MKRLRGMRKLASAAVFLLISTLVFPFTAPSVMAQATTGGLTGVVSDDQGAVIPGATVIARNAATGIETRTVSNDSGIYSFARLQPGTYNVSVERDGFKRQEYQGVTVNVGSVTSRDALLQPGLSTETVTVTATGEELVQKEQVQISSTFESRKVSELPSNVAGGGIDTLALLAPGVVPGFGNVNSNGTTLSVNGNRARANNFTIDGQDNNDLSIGGPTFFVNNQDTVAEFQIITNNFSAEYGRNQGAVVNIVTKSGTNEFHGSAFWFHRDRKLFDSLNNIEKRSGEEDPQPFLRNVYGGTIGGPIKTDRIFFFGSYQLVTDRETFTARGGATLAPEEIARLKAAFPGSAAVQAFADFSPFAITDFGTLSERADRPTDTTLNIGGQLFRSAYIQRVFATPADEHQFSVRGDVRINDKHSVWWRHLYQDFVGKNFLGGSSGFTGDIPAVSTHTGGTWTTQISNTAVNEFQFSFSELSVIFGGGCEGLKGCISHPDNIADSLTNISFAGFRNTRGDTVQTIGAATNLPQGRVVRAFQFRDNFAKTMGRHQLKLGADIRRLTNSVPFLPFVNGAFRFGSGAALANNVPGSVTLGAGTVEISYNETDQFYYFQDDWKVRDNLTLNLGLRYEYTGQPINTLNEISVARESDPAQALWRQSLPLEARTFPKLPADKNNIAPRLGFAWTPSSGGNRVGRALFGESGQTVISGGYSIAYEPGFYNIMLNVSTSAPLVFLNTVGGAALPLPSANPTGSAVQSAAQARGVLQVNTFDPRLLAQTIVAPDFHAPYSQQWSFRVQREISRNNVLEARYVGTRGVGLFQTLNRNAFSRNIANGFTVAGIQFPAFPQFLPPGADPQTCVNDPATPDNEAACNGRIGRTGLIRSRENTAQSTYHGLQTRWQANLANQLSFGASYTFSKAMDNASEIFSFFENAAAQSPFNINAAEKSLSGFDRRHAYAMNFIWDVPALRDQEGFVGRVLGGWQLNGTYFLANGQRYTVSQFCNFACLGQGASYQDTTWAATFIGFDNFRPFWGNPGAPRTAAGISQIDAAFIFGAPIRNINGFYSLNELNNGNVVEVTKDQVRYIFGGPGAARIFGSPFGDVPRNSEAGPRINQLNLGMFKNIRVRENVRLQFRAEAFNALNHPAPGVGGFVGGDRTPDFFIEDAGTPDGFNDFTGMTKSRRVWQLGLRLVF